MPRPTVVLCPALDPEHEAAWRPRVAAALAQHDVPVVAPERLSRVVAQGEDERLRIASWVADQAIAITAANSPGSLLVVSSGAANRVVPALALSQRASRHPIVAYVMVDGPLPQPGRAGLDWPDAPVRYLATDSADPLETEASLASAGLRGWSVRRGDPVAEILAIAVGWPDTMP